MCPELTLAHETKTDHGFVKVSCLVSACLPAANHVMQH